MAAILAAVAASRWPGRVRIAHAAMLLVLAISAIWAVEAFAYTAFTYLALVALEAARAPRGTRRRAARAPDRVRRRCLRGRPADPRAGDARGHRAAPALEPVPRVRPQPDPRRSRGVDHLCVRRWSPGLALGAISAGLGGGDRLAARAGARDRASRVRATDRADRGHRLCDRVVQLHRQPLIDLPAAVRRAAGGDGRDAVDRCSSLRAAPAVVDAGRAEAALAFVAVDRGADARGSVARGRRTLPAHRARARLSGRRAEGGAAPALARAADRSARARGAAAARTRHPRASGSSSCSPTRPTSGSRR